jgi:hypothetical protein
MAGTGRGRDNADPAAKGAGTPAGWDAPECRTAASTETTISATDIAPAAIVRTRLRWRSFTLDRRLPRRSWSAR